jgi:hypothetical protein
MDAERCQVCDRVKATEADWQAWQDAGGWNRVMPPGVCFRVNDLPGFGRHSIHADDDCESHAVNWRARALAAEGRLRTLERMLLQADNIEIEWDAPNDRWQFAAETSRAFPTIEGCLDAWAAAHKEEA